MSAFDKAWSVLKALPEQQMFEPAYPKTNLAETRWDDEGFDAGEGSRAMGTVHPAIAGLLQREQNKRDKELMGDDYKGPRTGERALPNLNLQPGARQAYMQSKYSRPGIDQHPDWWMHASNDSRRLGEKEPYADKMTRAPQTYSHQKEYPTNEEVSNFREDYPPWMQESLHDTTLGRRAKATEEGR